MKHLILCFLSVFIFISPSQGARKIKAACIEVIAHMPTKEGNWSKIPTAVQDELEKHALNPDGNPDLSPELTKLVTSDGKVGATYLKYLGSSKGAFLFQILWAAEVKNRAKVIGTRIKILPVQKSYQAEVMEKPSLLKDVSLDAKELQVLTVNAFMRLALGDEEIISAFVIPDGAPLEKDGKTPEQVKKDIQALGLSVSEMPKTQFSYAKVEGNTATLKKLLTWPYLFRLALSANDAFTDEPEGSPNSDLKKGPITTTGFATAFFTQPKYANDRLFQVSLLAIADRGNSTAKIRAALIKAGARIIEEKEVGAGPTTRLFTVEGIRTDILKLLSSNINFERRIFYFGIETPQAKTITDIEKEVSELEIEN